MKVFSFKGGIHPPEFKEYTAHLEIEKAKDPKVVIIPLQQHIGAPAEAVVEVGDLVKVGQMIAKPGGFVSAAIHASVSGKISEIGMKPGTNGEILCAVIESDGKNEVDDSIQPRSDLSNLSKKEIVSEIEKAGIVGMGGASFPTHVKLSPPDDKKIDTVILNGAECEPFLTCDHRLMLEKPEEIIKGLELIMRGVGAEKGIIGIETNKPDALEVMFEKASNYKSIEVVGVETKYPQGAEKQLIQACLDRVVPSGGLPMDVGVVVNNVGTSYQVYESLSTGMPLIERVVTLSGSALAEPKNMSVKIGTSVNDLLEQCGGLKEEVRKVIMGGPMCGQAVSSTEIPIMKGSSGVLFFNEEDGDLPEASNCIRCASCIHVCPVYLQPLHISAYAEKNQFDIAERYRPMDCIECGSCSFVCPAKIQLLQGIKIAKNEVQKKKNK